MLAFSVVLCIDPSDCILFNYFNNFCFISQQEVPFYLDDFLIPDSTDFLQDLYVIGLQEGTSQR